MITVVCGEDVSASRSYYSGLKQNFTQKGDFIRFITPGEIEEINRWLGDSPTLFATTTIFFTEGINKKIGRGSKEYKLQLEKVIERSDIHLVDWEDASGRELKLGKKVTVKEFKLDLSIFRLLDLCSPGQKKEFILSLTSLSQSADLSFIFLMLVRHIRKLMLAAAGAYDPTVPSWQRGKLSGQAKLWKNGALVLFYEALQRIDVGMKTSSNPYTLKQSLDILAVHFL